MHKKTINKNILYNQKIGKKSKQKIIKIVNVSYLKLKFYKFRIYLSYLEYINLLF